MPRSAVRGRIFLCQGDVVFPVFPSWVREHHGGVVCGLLLLKKKIEKVSCCQNVWADGGER